MARKRNRPISTVLLFAAPDLAVSALLLAMLAAIIFIPKFLQMRERRQVADARILFRQTAMALDAYYVDHEAFPPSGVALGARGGYESQQIWQPEVISSLATGVTTANSFASSDSGAHRVVTFRLPGPNEKFATLTTPIAYLAGGLREDPFATTAGASIGYFAHASRLGWILFSLGPDRDERDPDGPGEISPRVEQLYDLVNHFPYMWEPSDELVRLTYDPTNGIGSEGDIYWAGGN